LFLKTSESPLVGALRDPESEKLKDQKAIFHKSLRYKAETQSITMSGKPKSPLVGGP